MLRNYTSTIDSTGKEITIISTIMHNPLNVVSIFTMDLLDSGNDKLARVFEMRLEPKETICLDTKICISGGQKLMFNGGDIILSGNEDNV